MRAIRGILDEHSTVTVTGSAVTGNTADVGGGIFNNGGTVLIMGGSTVVGNTADLDGGGIFKDRGTVLILGGSQVIENTPDNCFPSGYVPHCTG